MRKRSHISISYGGHRYGRKIEWAEKVPSFYEMETNSPYKDYKTNDKRKKQNRLIGYEMGEEFFDTMPHTLQSWYKLHNILYRECKKMQIFR